MDNQTDDCSGCWGLPHLKQMCVWIITNKRKPKYKYLSEGIRIMPLDGTYWADRLLFVCVTGTGKRVKGR